MRIKNFSGKYFLPLLAFLIFTMSIISTILVITQHLEGRADKFNMIVIKK